MPPDAAWPSLFAPMAEASTDAPVHLEMADGERSRLDDMTRTKLHQALHTRKSLRHIVLLTNAYTSSNASSNSSSPTASFYSEVSTQGYSQYRQETIQEEVRRKEQEWFDALLDGFIEAEDVEGEDGYVDVSFREPLATEVQEEELTSGTDALADSGWMEQKDFSAHTAYQIRDSTSDSLSDLSLGASTPSLSDLPELTRDNDTPEASPELASISVNDLQLVPSSSSALLKPARQSIDLSTPPALPADSLSYALKSLQLSTAVDLPAGWDLQDFGPFPKASHRRPTRVLDDIYLSLPRRSSHQKRQAKASILVQSLLLS